MSTPWVVLVLGNEYGGEGRGYADESRVPAKQHAAEGRDGREQVRAPICFDVAPYSGQVEVGHACRRYTLLPANTNSAKNVDEFK